MEREGNGPRDGRDVSLRTEVSLVGELAAAPQAKALGLGRDADLRRVEEVGALGGADGGVDLAVLDPEAVADLQGLAGLDRRGEVGAEAAVVAFAEARFLRVLGPVQVEDRTSGWRRRCGPC